MVETQTDNSAESSSIGIRQLVLDAANRLDERDEKETHEYEPGRRDRVIKEFSGLLNDVKITRREKASLMRGYEAGLLSEEAIASRHQENLASVIGRTGLQAMGKDYAYKSAVLDLCEKVMRAMDKEGEVNTPTMHELLRMTVDETISPRANALALDISGFVAEYWEIVKQFLRDESQRQPSANARQR